MSIENVTTITPSMKTLPINQDKWHWPNLNRLRLPLLFCLLCTLLVRIWLVMHNNAILEGDEALVGIQAEHILHGEWPIYFYGQPYMGSLEAYLLALIFAIVGPSPWALRTEPIILSLVITLLTWKLAGALANGAQLSPSHKRWFQTIAALGATFPPLYDLVAQLRIYGGYIETFIVILSILYTTLRLTQRWQAGAKVRELLWRWALLGFLIGLGFWIYPLVIVAVLAAVMWILAYMMVELIKGLQQQRSKEVQSPPTIFTLLQGLLPALAAIPSALVGFAPALYWGALNHWQNITYILGSGTATSSDRISLIRGVVYLYRTCSTLRIIGGALPTDPGTTTQNPHLITPALLLGLTCIIVSTLVWALSFIWHQPTLVQARRLLTLPLLFAGSCAFIFCVSSATTVGLVTMCGPLDWVGRYATPLMLALPFFLATALMLLVFSILISIRNRFWGGLRQQILNNTRRLSQMRGPGKIFSFPTMFVGYALEDKLTPSGSVTSSSQTEKQPIHRSHLLLQIGLLFCLLTYVGAQLYAYGRSNPHYTFQTSGCVVAPENDDPIIAYLQQQHIHYVWANNWVGNVITFKMQSNVIAVDPHEVTNTNYVNRIPAYTNAVLHADRPSIITLVFQNESHPKILTALDRAHITYRTARFPSAPAYHIDALVITPLNRSFSPFMGPDLVTAILTC